MSFFDTNLEVLWILWNKPTRHSSILENSFSLRSNSPLPCSQSHWPYFQHVSAFGIFIMSLAVVCQYNFLHLYCLAWKFGGRDMQKVSVCIFSEELLVEQAATGTRPQATWCTLLWEFQGCLAQAGRGTPWGRDCQSGMKHFPLLDETSWLYLVALLQGETRCHGAGATCCAAGSLLAWAARCGTLPPCPRVKLGAKPGEICLFWKVSLSQSLISIKGTHSNLPLLLLYLIRPQLTTLVLGAGNSVIRALTLFWILKASCFYGCQIQSFRSPRLAAVLSCELIATPGQVSVGIVLPGTNNIDFQGKEGVSASRIKSCVLFMILSSVRKKCSITLLSFSRRE